MHPSITTIMPQPATTITGFESLDSDFMVCFPRTDCPQRARCLRASAYESIVARKCARVIITNPATEIIPSCPNFLDQKPVFYAHGITHLYSQLPYDVARGIKRELLSYFGKNSYYRIHRKERYITVQEQNYIRHCFIAAGLDPQLICYDAMIPVFQSMSPMIRK